MPSVWFSIIDTVHLFGLIFLFITALVLNLRLLGGVMHQVPAAKVAQQIAPYIGVSLAVMLGSGTLLFTSAAPKYYASTPFRIKMGLLVLAVVFQLIAYQRMVKLDAKQLDAFQNRILAILCLLFWISVALAGRSIAFFQT